MKGFLQRILGRGQDDHPSDEGRGNYRLEIEEFGHGLVRIDALDFIGHEAKSPNGRYRLIWAGQSPYGSRGGYREAGHGTWSLLQDDRIVLSGKLERPQDGKPLVGSGSFPVSGCGRSFAAVIASSPWPEGDCRAEWSRSSAGAARSH